MDTAPVPSVNQRLVKLAHEYRAKVQYTLDKRSEFELLGPVDHPAVAEQQHQIAMARKALAEIDAVLAEVAE